jgi:hypothetical protein
MTIVIALYQPACDACSALARIVRRIGLSLRRASFSAK